MEQIESKYKMTGLSSTIFVITLNVNGLDNNYLHVNGLKRRARLIGFKFFKKRDLNIHFLWETHVKYKDKYVKSKQKNCTIIHN